MNLAYMKYAVEVANTGSINKAAEKLYVGQPNLSRAIKELEASLGVTIFDRSARGMVPTADGEIFIRYARTILKQVDDVENFFCKGTVSPKRFSISVPRASYISEAFASFTGKLDPNDDVELFYKETNAMRAIKNILQSDYKLGIVRYAETYDKYYKAMMDEKGLNYELVAEFTHVLVMNKNCPLADSRHIGFKDLEDLVEIAHADPFVPSLPVSEVMKDELPCRSRRRIYVFERASQFELLSHKTDAYMWVSPIPKKQLDRFGLVQKSCPDNTRRYKDVLIHRNDYTLSKLDSMFISELCASRRICFDQV